MGRLKHNERVVRSVPDKRGYGYNKSSEGGARTKAAVRYMDKHEQQQLYVPGEDGRIRETDRHEATERIDNTDSKYQQHMVFTTELKSSEAYVNESDYAQQVADSVKRIRPDAEIYAVSVHTDKEGEGHIHAHVTFGTDTVIRTKGEGEKNEMAAYRREAYQHEQHIREHGREIDRTPEERQWVEQRHEQQQHARQQSTSYRDDELGR